MHPRCRRHLDPRRLLVLPDGAFQDPVAPRARELDKPEFRHLAQALQTAALRETVDDLCLRELRVGGPRRLYECHCLEVGRESRAVQLDVARIATIRPANDKQARELRLRGARRRRDNGAWHPEQSPIARERRGGI